MTAQHFDGQVYYNSEITINPPTSGIDIEGKYTNR